MGPKMSMDSSSSGSVAGNKVRGVMCRRKARQFCAHAVHLAMVIRIFVTIEGQQYTLRTVK